MTRTDDGWKLVAQRYWSPALDRRRPPVVLCHGFGYNAHFFDLEPSVSLAQYLAEAGFDVWVVNLRGSGQSSKWALGAVGGGDALVGRLADRIAGADVPQAGFVSLDPKYSRWNFDDHVVRDVPAVVRLVQQQTGSPQLAWLGHSMGGNVLLAYLSKYGQDASIARLVTVGSQVTMPDGQLVIQFLIELLARREGQLTGRAPNPEAAFASMNNVFFNQHNTDPTIVHALATYGHDMPSVGLIRQYLVLSQTGQLYDARQQIRYADGLGNIRCPYLIVGGSADQIAPPVVQRFLYQHVGSTDKTLLTVGRRTGFSVDCGHNDSLVGRSARAEIFPVLARWLATGRVT